MKTSDRPHKIPAVPVRWLFTSLGLLVGLCLLLFSSINLVSADSGGFPTDTPRPTATVIVLPTQPPTPTATLIILPTQDTSNPNSATDQKSLEEPEGSNTGSKSLAQLEPNQVDESAQNSEDSGNASLFLIGLLIGLVLLVVGVLGYWLLRRTGVIT